MNGLMGDYACKPVRADGIYAVVLRGDLAALKERDRRLNARIRELCHENALLAKALDDERQRRREVETSAWAAERENDIYNLNGG